MIGSHCATVGGRAVRLWGVALCDGWGSHCATLLSSSQNSVSSVFSRFDSCFTVARFFGRGGKIVSATFGFGSAILEFGSVTLGSVSATLSGRQFLIRITLWLRARDPYGHQIVIGNVASGCGGKRRGRNCNGKSRTHGNIANAHPVHRFPASPCFASFPCQPLSEAPVEALPTNCA